MTDQEEEDSTLHFCANPDMKKSEFERMKDAVAGCVYLIERGQSDYIDDAFRNGLDDLGYFDSRGYFEDPQRRVILALAGIGYHAVFEFVKALKDTRSEKRAATKTKDEDSSADVEPGSD